jgi:hypothetical protein
MWFSLSLAAAVPATVPGWYWTSIRPCRFSENQPLRPQSSHHGWLGPAIRPPQDLGWAGPLSMEV